MLQDVTKAHGEKCSLSRVRNKGLLLQTGSSSFQEMIRTQGLSSLQLSFLFKSFNISCCWVLDLAKVYLLTHPHFPGVASNSLPFCPILIFLIPAKHFIVIHSRIELDRIEQKIRSISRRGVLNFNRERHSHLIGMFLSGRFPHRWKIGVLLLKRSLRLKGGNYNFTIVKTIRNSKKSGSNLCGK